MSFLLVVARHVFAWQEWESRLFLCSKQRGDTFLLCVYSCLAVETMARLSVSVTETRVGLALELCPTEPKQRIYLCLVLWLLTGFFVLLTPGSFIVLISWRPALTFLSARNC